MKKIFATLAIVVAGTIALNAQSGPTNEEQLILNALKLEKRAIVTQFLALPDDQAGIFWPIYDKYEAERKKITARRYANIQEYVSQYLSLSPENTDKLVKEAIAIQKADIALRDKYYKQVNKKVNSNVAARFYQVEDAIQTAIKMELYQALPVWEGR